MLERVVVGRGLVPPESAQQGGASCWVPDAQQRPAPKCAGYLQQRSVGSPRGQQATAGILPDVEVVVENSR